jgi:hypothetical protein
MRFRHAASRAAGRAWRALGLPHGEDLAVRAAKAWATISWPATVLFLLHNPRQHPGYDFGWRRKVRLAYRMWRTTREVTSATSYKAHLAMASKLVEIPPEVEGVVVECGCWYGGSTANLSLICEVVGRRLIVYDSFEGLPAPEPGDRYANPQATGLLRADLEEVRENVRRCGALECCDFRKGWFRDTLPHHEEPIVLAFLDVDWQASLDDCMTHLWPHLVDTGYVFIDEFVLSDYCALFWSERYWQTRFGRTPPGLIGSGSGVGTGGYFMGPWNERNSIQDPTSIAYTRKDFSGHWAFYPEDAGRFEGADAELAAELDRLAEGNGSDRDRATERRLLALRHTAGIRALAADGPRPPFPEPDRSPQRHDSGLPEFRAEHVTPGLMRAAIMRDGFILVRGLVDRAEALLLADQIDRTFAERERFLEGAAPAEGYYEEFRAWVRRYDAALREVRPWIREGGGVLAVDSPAVSAHMVNLFKRAGVRRLVESYLGQQPLMSLEKTTLRKAEPHVAGAWHQDGSFMGDVRALNLWLALSRCGDEAPGLDIVPCRLDELVTRQTDEALLPIQVSQQRAERAAGGREIVRPIFEPGDAVFFDEMLLHKTGSDPSMPNPRFAIESWFFAPAAFPDEYAPIAV